VSKIRRGGAELLVSGVNAKVWAVRIAYLHRRGSPTALRNLMVSGIRPQRRYDHRKKIRPGTPDLPNDPACLIHKRSGHRVVLFVCKCYNISVHNPPDNLSASPPWPPGFSNAPDPSRYGRNIVRARGFRVNHIPDDLHIFPPALRDPNAPERRIGTVGSRHLSRPRPNRVQ